jgi:1,4-dihydroxy-2-naphthoyl-CoA hydrolase
MTETNFEGLKKYFQAIYDTNSFVNLLEMKLTHIEPGLAELTMPIDPLKHTNLYHVAHGGAMASVADTAMGVACASLGRRVVTLELNMNFIKSAQADTQTLARARVVHNGRNTLVVECDVLGDGDSLVLKARGTFYVVGQFDIDLHE